MKFVATKKDMTTNLFSPFSFVVFLDPGSGMGKNQDPGSGINIPDPQHWYDRLVLDCGCGLCDSGLSLRHREEASHDDVWRGREDVQVTLTV